ncbi:MAG: hypothetical protein H6581_15190 [Bacteroidia bacterium]|nr:hypothetical protein [Bacteroidia bacterium]
MKKFLLSIAILIGLWGCHPYQKEIETRHAEVMQIHDQAMAKMDEIYAVMDQLKALDQDTSLTESEYHQKIDASIIQLQAADDAMMDWMHDYKAPTGDEDPQESISYLALQKAEIKMVNKTIDEALQMGKEVLNNGPR